MIQLKTENYSKVLEPLSKVTFNHLFARTVLEQKMDGEVFVDDQNEPTTYYIKHSYGMSLLFGRTDNSEFNRQLTSYLRNENNGRNASEWLQVFPADWNEKLNQLLNENIVEPSAIKPDSRQIIKWSRVNFKFQPLKYLSQQQSVPKDFKLIRTDSALFDQIAGSVVPSCFWRNRKEFAENAVGFSLIHNGKPASTAFASFIHDQQLEIGIETSSEFRGKGLAQISCSALIDYCLANDFEPIWSCRLENIGSFLLAQKLGFEPTLIQPYYQLPHQPISVSTASSKIAMSSAILFAGFQHKI